MDSEKMTINIHEILNKIIESGERSLDMQGDFLKAVYELKSMMLSGDQDRASFHKELQNILNHTTAIHDKMKVASNETIIKMIEDHDKRTVASELAINDFKHMLESMYEILNKQSENHGILRDTFAKVSEITTADKKLKWVIGAITAIITAASAIIITLNQLSISEFKADTLKVIEEIRLDVNKVHEEAHKP